MLPPNWGRQQAGSGWLDLQAEGLNLRERYRPLGPSEQLDEVFEMALGAGAKFVYLDRPYTDFDYRSDLSHFYGRAFRPPPQTTERLIFSDEDEVLGVCVVRPLPRQVGRTLMTPPAKVSRYVTCTTQMNIHAFGYEWPVKGYPFTSQDGEYGVCAHAAIWSIARYHHLRFGTDRYTTSAIIESAGLRERPDKTARSDGLYAFDIARAFRGMGLPALQYDIENIAESSEGRESMDTVACRYLNSGIPVAVLTSNHMMVLVGYGEKAGGGIFYIVSDDNHSAYKRVEQVTGDSDDAWELLIIPQPGRIHVNGEAAEVRAQEAFEDRVRANAGPSHLFERWEKNELRVRTYAAPSPTYVGRLTDRGTPDTIRHHHVYAPKGNWLWISEFQDMAAGEGRRVVGEIVIDATSMNLDPTPVFGNIDGWAYTWPEGEGEPNVIQAESAGARFASALGDRSEQPDPPSPSFAPYAPPPVD